MHYFLAFIQASVMCLLQYFRGFLQPSGVIPPSLCLWGSSSWTCSQKWAYITSGEDFIAEQSLPSLLCLCTSKSCKSQQARSQGVRFGSRLTYSQIGRSGWFSFANWIRSLVRRGTGAAAALRLTHLDPAAAAAWRGWNQLPGQPLLPEDGKLTVKPWELTLELRSPVRQQLPWL